LKTFKVNIRSERYVDEATQLFIKVGEYAKTYRKAIEELPDNWTLESDEVAVEWTHRRRGIEK